MASLSTEKSKTGKVTCRRIQFTDGNRVRQSIRLPDTPAKAAETVLARVEELNALAITGTSWGPELARWVASLPAQLHDKLAKVGLVPRRAEVEKAKLGPFIASYISGSGVKRATVTSYRNVERNLVAYFGADKPLSAITAGDADDWRRWLASDQGLADNTGRRRCGIARQFFLAAVRKKLIADNPFGHMKGIAVRANRSRDYFVSREEAAKVIAACPDGEWRLIFALSRYGGLRCPSETLALRWGDINWDTEMMHVRSSKTEHHGAGHESRQTPIFPELKPFLEAAWHAAPEGSEFVIERYRGGATNLRTSLAKIIIKAGLTPWEKLFQNLRATRATELAAVFPGHVAAAWLGHSELVAQKHYWQVTDADVQKALTMVTGAGCETVQLTPEGGGKASSPTMPQVVISANNDQLPKCTAVQSGPGGLEPPIVCL